jgi:hypothetical protein
MHKLMMFFLTLPLLCSATQTLPKNFFILKEDATLIQPATIQSPNFAKGQEMSVAVAIGNLAFHHMKNQYTAIRFEVGGELLRIHWKENIEFHQENFYLIVPQIGFFTNKYQNWWILFTTGVAFDAKHFNLKHFSQWVTTFYAKYNYQDKFNVHVGLLGYYGFRYNEVYPIIGIDFALKRLQFNLIFPYNISLEWHVLDWLVPFVKTRFIAQPRRLSAKEPRSLGAILYKATGTEIGLRAVIKKHCHIDVYGGRMWSPNLRVEGRNGTNRIYYNLESTYYGGLGIYLPF